MKKELELPRCRKCTYREECEGTIHVASGVMVENGPPSFICVIGKVACLRELSHGGIADSYKRWQFAREQKEQLEQGVSSKNSEHFGTVIKNGVPKIQ